MGSQVMTFRLHSDDKAKLDELLAREGINLAQWVRQQIAQAQVPAPVGAVHVEAEAVCKETARLREEKDRTVLLSPETMTVFQYLFSQCVDRWPEYRASNGLAEWLADSVFSFYALNGRILGISLGPYAAGSLGATPMLRTLLSQAIHDFLQGAARL